MAMSFKQTFLAAAVCFCPFSSVQAISTGLDFIDSNTNLTFYGDFRLRYELDWDSHRPNGTERPDRTRGRWRARGGFNYQLTEDWSLGVRIRSGSSHSQQSPHLTFASDDPSGTGGGTRDDVDAVVDRYFVQYKHGPITAWGGRNITPFWQQNELFWDEDATLTGIAGVYDTKVGKGTLSGIAGAFFLPDGGYELNGHMISGQLKYALPAGSSQFIFAGGIHFIDGETGARYLLNRNGERDYLIGVGSAQWTIPIKGIPLSLGADVFKNFENYNTADIAPFKPATKDETLGYVFSAQLGQLKKRHDWLVGYSYAHIELFAVNASYAQDDWHRFGNGPQTDASDFQGHEVRLGYAISKNINLLARVYLVKSIAAAPQDNNRFRVDLNWKF